MHLQKRWVGRGPSHGGWGRGGTSPKLHLRCDNHGQALVVLLTPVQQHDSVFEALKEEGAVQRPGPGRPKLRPRRVPGDKGYSYPHIRDYLRRHDIRVTIPRRKDQHRGGPFDAALYKARNIIERFINRLKHLRLQATRYEKLADSYRTMWVIAIAVFSLGSSNAP